MMSVEQQRFFAVVAAALAEYVKVPTQIELDAWWGTCRVFSLSDVEMALKAHAMDPDDGKRAPRPIDLKRRLAAPRRHEYEPGRELPASPQHEARMEHYRQACISSPSVRATSHAIAMRHGNRPWWPDGGARFDMPMPARRNREPGED